MKFRTPKILMLDIPQEFHDQISLEDYIVVQGSLGIPYRIQRSSDFKQVGFNHSIPINYHEFEITVINLDSREQDIVRTAPQADIPGGEHAWYCKADKAFIDPRPIKMDEMRENFLMNLSRGGVLIVFGAPLYPLSYRWSNYQGLARKKDAFNHFQWPFLPTPADITVRDKFGTELIIENADNQLKSFCEKYYSEDEGAYRCTLAIGDSIKDQFQTLFINKHEEILGGIYAPKSGGRIYILPFCKNMSGVITELISTILPSESPEIFPHHTANIWTSRDEYELDLVIKIKQEITTLQSKTSSKIDKLEKKIEDVNQKYEYLYGLLTKSGSELKDDVKSALEFIGFENVLDVDNEDSEATDNVLLEDLRIDTSEAILLIEVKGINGNPSDNDVAQVSKYVLRRIRKWQNTFVEGATIVNIKRNLPPLSRNPDSAFTKFQIDDALQDDRRLINTWTLFMLLKGMIKHKWDGKFIREKFDQMGEMDLIPVHYKQLGEVTKIFKKVDVVSISLTKSDVKVGNTIAFITDTEYFETTVISIEIDKKPINKAAIGDIIGIKVDSDFQHLKNKMNIYLVDSS